MSRWIATNFCVVQLTIAAAVVPANLVTESWSRWVFGPVACRVWLFGQMLLVAETMWSLVSMTLDRLLAADVLLASTSYATLTNRKSYTVGCVVGSWLVAVAVLVPIGLSLVGGDDIVLEEVCAVGVTRDDAVVLFLGAFLFPVALTLTGNVVIFASRLCKMRRGRCSGDGGRSSALDDNRASAAALEENHGSSSDLALTGSRASDDDDIKTGSGSAIAALLAVSLMSLAAWAPFFFTYMLLPFCSRLCVDPAVWSIFVWMGYTNSGTAPFFFFIDTEPRSQAKRIAVAVLDPILLCFRRRASSRKAGESQRKTGSTSSKGASSPLARGATFSDI